MNALQDSQTDAQLLISQLAELRVIVGLLGERKQAGWWTSQFMESGHDIFLQPVMPKSLLLAKIRGTTEAARRIHDDAVGRGSYHLFRLPVRMEAQIAVLYTSRNFVAAGPPAEAKSLLWQLAADNTGRGVGAVSMGNIEELNTPTSVERLAGMYKQGFDNEQPAFPFYSAL